jgi:V/A-type H+/Na+-transporting ATPase subunit E
MEVQLAELIAKIKAEGIGAAEEESRRLVDEARTKAAAILAEARAEAGGILAQARDGAAREEAAGKAALAQAARNSLLSLKGSIVSMLDALAKDQAGKALDPALLARLIPQVAKALAAGEALEATLAPEDLEALGDHFAAALAKELGAGATLRAGASVGAGFRIAVKDGSYSYDFSAEKIGEMMSQYLSPRLRAILDAAAGD